MDKNIPYGRNPEARKSGYLIFKMYFKPKVIQGGKESHCILAKGTIQQADVTIIKIEHQHSKFHKKILDIKHQININAIIVKDLSS